MNIKSNKYLKIILTIYLFFLSHQLQAANNIEALNNELLKLESNRLYKEKPMKSGFIKDNKFTITPDEYGTTFYGYKNKAFIQYRNGTPQPKNEYGEPLISISYEGETLILDEPFDIHDGQVFSIEDYASNTESIFVVRILTFAGESRIVERNIVYQKNNNIISLIGELSFESYSDTEYYLMYSRNNNLLSPKDRYQLFSELKVFIENNILFVNAKNHLKTRTQTYHFNLNHKKPIH